jgi:hypothetical protein
VDRCALHIDIVSSRATMRMENESRQTLIAFDFFVGRHSFHFFGSDLLFALFFRCDPGFTTKNRIA